MASENDLYIFPLPFTATTARSMLTPIQHPPPTHPQPTIFSPRTGPTPIYVHFRGRRAPYRYFRSPPPGLSPPPARVELSLWAHLSRSGAPLPIPLPAEPWAYVPEGTQIDLCHVDFAVDMNERITREDFGRMLQRLAPAGAGERAALRGGVGCGVREVWDDGAALSYGRGVEWAVS